MKAKVVQKDRDNTICLTVALLSTFVTCGCRQAEQSQKERGVTEKLVTFDVPKDWVLQKHLTDTNLETFQFLIPDAATDNTPDSANAGISIEKTHGGLDLTNFAKSRLQSTPNLEGYVVLTNIFASDKWCSAMTHGQQGSTPYVIMDRFGFDHGVTIFFRVVQPILANDRAVADSISNFNLVVASLKIAGTNAVNSEMREDHNTIWLRAFSDMDTNWMTNELTAGSPLQRK